MAASTSTNSHTHDIVAKLWNLCNVLKDDGVTYHQMISPCVISWSCFHLPPSVCT